MKNYWLNKRKAIDLSEFTMTRKLCINPDYFTYFKIGNDRDSFQPIKNVLIGKLQESPPMSHPGRMYGCYDYDWERNAWIKNKNHPMYKEIKNDTSK